MIFHMFINTRKNFLMMGLNSSLLYSWIFIVKNIISKNIYLVRKYIFNKRTKIIGTFTISKQIRCTTRVSALLEMINNIVSTISQRLCNRIHFFTRIYQYYLHIHKGIFQLFTNTQVIIRNTIFKKIIPPFFSVIIPVIH